MSATIKDVAKMAGVSISTVSRVVNDSKPVSPDARRRVLHAIEVLDYEPNEIARSLVTRKSNIIGVIVEDFGLSFVSQVLRGVEEVARMYDYDILVSSTYGDPEIEDRYMKLLLQKQVEGIVVITESNNKNRLQNLKELKIPVSYLNRYYRNEDVATISIDNIESTAAMVEYLFNKGHRNIGYLGIEKDFEITVERFKQRGYKEAIKKFALKERILELSENSDEAFLDIESKLIESIKNEGITAIMAYSDEAAIKIMNLLKDNEIRVPEDVSVTGVGDIKMSEQYRPKLTTLKEPLYDYGAVSIRSIIKAIKGEEKMSQETVLLPFYIIERESVKEI
ncbi:MAG: LacI family transcriptional regulator [Tissierellia bacterium]|nr:LacI family transcriptional regulator [Tissierellia bacterium]